MTLLLQENVPLAPVTTLGIGGPARYFVEARDDSDVLEANTWARERQLPIFVLGGGSNIVVADEGFPGVVIHIAVPGMEASPQFQSSSQENAYEVGASIKWDSFVAFAVENNLAGIECLSGIPGSVGGTPVQNVGAYGQEVSSVIRTVRVLDRVESKIRELNNDECGFSYRKSIFNTAARDRYIVLSVIFGLSPGGAASLGYVELQEYFRCVNRRPSLREVREAVRNIRRRKAMLLVPNDPDCRSVGSFFKNPIVSETQYQDLANQFPDRTVPHYPVPHSPAQTAGTSPQVKLAAAWLIEQAGLAKGYPSTSQRTSPVGLSTKHTLALINRGGATAGDVVALMKEIQVRVHNRFNIFLQPEPVFVGFGHDHFQAPVAE